MPHHSLPPSLILIIDDSVDAIHLLSGMVGEQGEILFATSGAAGVELARQRRPQLILLDVSLGDTDGYAVCRQLRADSDTQDSAIIFVTAAADMDSEVAGLNAGAVDFITKPLNPPVVQARVRTHLNLQRTAALQAQLANQDGLTGLFNRRFFDATLEREFLRHKRQKLPLALAFIDIDFFKLYNDHYGHQDGDACLRAVADLIYATTRRPGELCARYGGEEFVAILPYTNAVDAQKYGERLCEQVAAECLPHARSSISDYVSISVGIVARIPGEADSAHSMIAAADQALYRAKAAGRGRCVLAGED